MKFDVGLLGRRLVAHLALRRLAAAALVALLGAGRRVEDDDVADARVRRSARRSGSRARAGRPASVGTIDSLGMRYGLTRNAWMPSARPSATATIRTSSSSEPDADDVFDACRRVAYLDLVAPRAASASRLGRRPRPRRRRRASTSAALGLGSRRPEPRPRLGRGGLGLGERLLVDGLARNLVVGRSGGLGGGIVQQTGLRRPPPGRCSGARGRGRACRRGRAGSRAWRAGRRRGRRPRSSRSSASAPGTCAPRRRRTTSCGP